MSFAQIFETQIFRQTPCHRSCPLVTRFFSTSRASLFSGGAREFYSSKISKFPTSSHPLGDLKIIFVPFRDKQVISRQNGGS
jgi:hypothetical protein